MNNIREKTLGSIAEKSETSIKESEINIGYTSINDEYKNDKDLKLDIGVNIDKGINIDNLDKPQNIIYNVDEESGKQNKNGIIVAAIAGIMVFGGVGFTLSSKINAKQGTEIITPTGSGNEVIYSSGGPEILGVKTEPKKVNTTLTSKEEESIKNLIKNFYNEHIDATNSLYDGYVKQYMTLDGSYRNEYDKLMLNHADMIFELESAEVLNIIKKSDKVFMVTVKDKIKVDRPENLSLQVCKTVYEVRNVDGNFLIHELKSETKLSNESKIIHVYEEDVIEDVFEEDVFEEETGEEDVYEEETGEEDIDEGFEYEDYYYLE